MTLMIKDSFSSSSLVGLAQVFGITDSGALMPGDPVKIAKSSIRRMIVIANDDNDDIVALVSDDGNVYISEVQNTTSESHGSF